MKPYGVLRFLYKWLIFKRKAKGIHAIHSPFVFDLVRYCLKAPRPKHPEIEHLRRIALRDRTVLNYADHGKGGTQVSRKVSDIARKSLKARPLAELIAALSSYFKAGNVLELGTSLGITTAYLSKEAKGMVWTLEGGEAVSEYAASLWKRLDLQNIKALTGPFVEQLDQLDPDLPFDLIFIDGHHQYAPTLSYFKRLMQHAHPRTVFILDDVHWSPDMEKAWQEIQQWEGVSLCLDLFFIGLVFMRPELSRQTIALRY